MHITKVRDWGPFLALHYHELFCKMRTMILFCSIFIIIIIIPKVVCWQQTIEMNTSAVSGLKLLWEFSHLVFILGTFVDYSSGTKMSHPSL